MQQDIIDPFARKITYLRMSVTDRCDLRCFYCMHEHMQFLPKSKLLTLEELFFIAENFVMAGIRKIRITGGEPLVRRDIMWLFEQLFQLKEKNLLDEITLTTNATQLSKYAFQLYDNAVRRVNISLDSLEEEKFKKISRGGRLSQVLDGIDAAQRAGLKIKINMVVLQNVNDNEIDDMILWCGHYGYDLTFIEVMPMGDIDDNNRINQYLPLTKIRQHIAEKWTICDMINNDYMSGPARYITLKETGQKIGFITPLTHNFCESCNRVRISCTGVFYPCLGQENSTDFFPLIRHIKDNDNAVEYMQQAIKDAISYKPKGHDFDISRKHGVKGQISRHMSVTGG